MTQVARTFTSFDDIRWRYDIKHRVCDAYLEWQAWVWDEIGYRGVLVGRVLHTSLTDHDALAGVAVKLALDAPEMRRFHRAEAW